MCGGVRFKYDQKLESALSEIYTAEQLDRDHPLELTVVVGDRFLTGRARHRSPT